MTRVLFSTVACLVAGIASAAGQSNIANARMQERAAGDLARTFQQLSTEAGPLWIGYAVPAHSPDWNACCGNNWSDGCCGRCALEDRHGETVGTEGARRAIPLEGGSSAVILYRVEGSTVTKVRAFSESCELDAGGRTVYWLNGVDAAASIALLKNLVQPKASGGEGPSRHVTSEALFAITAHRAPEAITTLINLARNGTSSRIRSDALFWLAHRAGEKAAGTITDAIDNDPDTKVKERAVFALSQMPDDTGVPKLIDVARSNRNPRVRKQAVFWLGQSKDPRALSFFEEVLLK